MGKISVILATFNEEKNVADCLKSVKGLADEIVVIDGSSTDKTVQIAKKFTPLVFVRVNPKMFHINKQLAIEKATNDWILYLDADERVTTVLAEEIKAVIENAPEEVSGFWIRRKNIIFNKWIEHTGWYPDYQLRLFRNGKGFLPCKSVHEQPVVHGETRFLNNSLEHFNYQSVAQFVNKLNNLYTENDKNLFLQSKKIVHWYDAVRWPTDEFLKRFFLDKGYKDGLHGLVLSLLQAFSLLVTFAKVWEQKGFKEEKGNAFLGKVNQELKRSFSHLTYWFWTAKIDENKNPLLRYYYKIQRKRR